MLHRYSKEWLAPNRLGRKETPIPGTARECGSGNADFQRIRALRDGLEPRYAAPLREARTEAEIIDADIAATCGATAPTSNEFHLYEQMHSYGSRGVRVAELLREFQEESLEILRCYLADSAARAADALMWGWWSYSALHAESPFDPKNVRDAYRALVAMQGTGCVPGMAASQEA